MPMEQISGTSQCVWWISARYTSISPEHRSPTDTGTEKKEIQKVLIRDTGALKEFHTRRRVLPNLLVKIFHILRIRIVNRLLNGVNQPARQNFALIQRVHYHNNCFIHIGFIFPSISHTISPAIQRGYNVEIIYKDISEPVNRSVDDDFPEWQTPETAVYACSRPSF